MNYYELYLKYKTKYIGLKKKLTSENYTISPTGIYNIEKINENFIYNLDIIKNLYNDYNCAYRLIKTYIDFVQGIFIEFSVKDKKINKKFGIDIISYCSIKIYQKNETLYIGFIENGKKEIIFEKFFKEINENKSHEPYIIFDMDNYKVIKFNNNFYKIEVNEIYKIINKLFEIDNYLYFSPFIHGARTGNTLFSYFINVDYIIKYLDTNNDKNILMIPHSYIRSDISGINTTKNKYYFREDDYLFESSNNNLKYNLFEIKNQIGIIFDYFLSYQLVNFTIDSSENTIALHFRGSDFCVTIENKSSKFFKILHFKYYYDSIYDIIKKNEKIDTFYIHVFSHPSDNITIEILIDYLKKKLKINLSHINIFFIFENEIFKKINLLKPTEYDVIKVISTYKYIIISNSSFALWSGFLSTNSILYICESDTTVNDYNELEYPIIVKEYNQAFKSLAKHSNSVVLTSKEYEYALACYIDIGKYIDWKYLNKFMGFYFDDENEIFNYYDFMIILYFINNSFSYNNCNDIYKIGLKQYETNFGVKPTDKSSIRYAKENLNLFKNKSDFIKNLLDLLKNNDNLYKIYDELEEDNNSKLKYKISSKINNVINFINDEISSENINFVYFIIILFLIKKNNNLYTKFIDSFTFETNIKKIVDKFLDKIICEISNYKLK